MILYFAPMEGLTYPEYRKVHFQLFGGPDAYFAPFLPTGNYDGKFLSRKLPDQGLGIPTIPQLIANNAEAFVRTARQLRDFGYPEINLNAGCPSGTVFSKYKGSGMLADLNTFRAFLESVSSQADFQLSIKTRMGVHSTDEFGALLELFNSFSISLLTVHARSRDDLYSGVPDLEGFRNAFSLSANPVCYNGDISGPEDVQRIQNCVPGLERMMIGRGAVRNPALFRLLRGGPGLTVEELSLFCDLLAEEYLRTGLSPRFTGERLKGLWQYMITLFDAPDALVKALWKARTLEEVQSVQKLLFCQALFSPSITHRLEP